PRRLRGRRRRCCYRQRRGKAVRGTNYSAGQIAWTRTGTISGHLLYCCSSEFREGWILRILDAWIPFTAPFTYTTTPGIKYTQKGYPFEVYQHSNGMWWSLFSEWRKNRLGTGLISSLSTIH
ncbi:unnamed protein product, partial [Ectocarpus sp. 12 AP-2014]